MKVFRFYPWEEISQFHKHRDRHYIHHLVWYSVLSAPCYTGVGYCLFVRGFARASSRINELLHTFFLQSTTGAGGNKAIIMQYRIQEISVWEEKTLPRVAILKETNSGFESKFYLFPHLDNMIAAHSVDDNLTRLTGYSVLLKAEDDSKLEDWSVGTTLVFPF